MARSDLVVLAVQDAVHALTEVDRLLALEGIGSSDAATSYRMLRRTERLAADLRRRMAPHIRMEGERHLPLPQEAQP